MSKLMLHIRAAGCICLLTICTARLLICHTQPLRLSTQLETNSFQHALRCELCFADLSAGAQTRKLPVRSAKRAWLSALINSCGPGLEARRERRRLSAQDREDSNGEECHWQGHTVADIPSKRTLPGLSSI